MKTNPVHAAALLLDLVRHRLMTMTDGDAEFGGTIYWFDDENPDWNTLLDAIGEPAARAAIARDKLTSDADDEALDSEILSVKEVTP